jgi:hypothetical protein
MTDKLLDGQDPVKEVRNYTFSRDYDTLYDLSMNQSVVCEVDFHTIQSDGRKRKGREICSTKYHPFTGSHCVGGRGKGYIDADSLDDFVSQCRTCNLIWFVPDRWGDSHLQESVGQTRPDLAEQTYNTMTQHNSIEVPDELVHSWWPSEGYYERDGDLNILADKAAQWGADQELAACCDWLRENADESDKELWDSLAVELREARRPKAPTLNEIALQFMGTIEKDGRYLPEITSTIVKALTEGGKALKELNG